MISLLLLLLCQPAVCQTSDAGTAVDLRADIRVVVFLGVECPLARLYAQRLNGLKAEFPQVEFRAYAPNRQDSVEEIAELQQFLDFPIQKSSDEATRLGAARSPEVFLLRDGEIAYSG